MSVSTFSDGKSGAGNRAFEILIDGFSKLRDSQKRYAMLDPARSAELYWTNLHGIASLKISRGRFLTTPAEDLATANIEIFLKGLRGGR